MSGKEGITEWHGTGLVFSRASSKMEWCLCRFSYQDSLSAQPLLAQASRARRVQMMWIWSMICGICIPILWKLGGQEVMMSWITALAGWIFMCLRRTQKTYCSNVQVQSPTLLFKKILLGAMTIIAHPCKLPGCHWLVCSNRRSCALCKRGQTTHCSLDSTCMIMSCLFIDRNRNMCWGSRMRTGASFPNLLAEKWGQQILSGKLIPQKLSVGWPSRVENLEYEG